MRNTERITNENIIKALANIDDVIDGINEYNSIIMKGSTLKLWKKCLTNAVKFLESVANISPVFLKKRRSNGTE